MATKATHAKTVKNSFEQRLTEAREAKGLTKDKLGKTINIHYSQIERYERNEASLSVDALKKMANALDVSNDYLINGPPQI